MYCRHPQLSDSGHHRPGAGLLWGGWLVVGAASRRDGLVRGSSPRDGAPSAGWSAGCGSGVAPRWAGAGFIASGWGSHGRLAVDSVAPTDVATRRFVRIDIAGGRREGAAPVSARGAASSGYYGVQILIPFVAMPAELKASRVHCCASTLPPKLLVSQAASTE